MPYDSLTNRTDAAALIPEDAASEILTATTEQSVVLSSFRTVNMSNNVTRMPALAALPTAYFVNGDTGLKQTTDVSWENKYLNVEEIAAIMPVPEAVLDDADYDIWAEARPFLAEAIGRTLDAAVFFGENAPAAWPDDIQTATAAAGSQYTYTTSAAADGGVAEDINQTMMLVEGDGFDVNGFVTYRGFRGIIRGARSTDGQKLMDVSQDEMEGAPVRYGMSGLWPDTATTGNPLLYAGDWSQYMVGIRQDMSWKVLDQAVIQDNTGAIVYNLAQQDMVALRVVARFAWQVANTVNHSNETAGTRSPVAALIQA